MGRGGGGLVGRRFFGKNVPKIIFAIMGGSKYFSDLFRPQFQNTLRNSSIPGPPLDFGTKIYISDRIGLIKLFRSRIGSDRTSIFEIN